VTGLTLGSLFDGMGGFPLAARRRGMTPLWASEIDGKAVSVTRRHFPEMAHVGDVTKLDGAKLPPADVVTFGSPCQDLSVAGRGEGLEGARSGLFFEAVRVMREMRDGTDGLFPRFAVWENVPGAFSSNGGEDFRQVLEALLGAAGAGVPVPRPPGGRWLPAGAVVGDGFSLAWRVMDARFWGVPQRRRRIFLVVDFGGEAAPEILFDRAGLPRDTVPRAEAGEEAAARPAEGAGQAGPLPPLGAFMPGQGSKAGGVAWSPDAAPTLKSVASGTNMAPAVVLPPAGDAASLNAAARDGGGDASLIFDARGNGDGRVAGALTGDHESRVTDYTSLVTRATAFNAAKHYLWEESAVAATMTSTQDHSPKTLAAAPEGRLSVRRLTPLECERLQGFPDGWTERGHDGEPVADTPRYRMIGNSVAVPCVEFVMRGVAEALRGKEGYTK
jgi:DNA (cytosine-5)-methyltransferase 1